MGLLVGLASVRTPDSPLPSVRPAGDALILPATGGACEGEGGAEGVAEGVGEDLGVDGEVGRCVVDGLDWADADGLVLPPEVAGAPPPGELRTDALAVGTQVGSAPALVE